MDDPLGRVGDGDGVNTREEATAKLDELCRKNPTFVNDMWVGKSPVCRVWCVLEQRASWVYPRVVAS